MMNTGESSIISPCELWDTIYSDDSVVPLDSDLNRNDDLCTLALVVIVYFKEKRDDFNTRMSAKTDN